MNTREGSYEKLVKRFLLLLFLLILSPVILSLAFKALRIYNESNKIFIAYILLTSGIFLSIYTIYYGFKAIKLLLDILFKK